MVFTNQHTYLTVHWQPVLNGPEFGQFGLRIDTPGQGTSVGRQAVKDAVQTFWTNAAAEIPTPYVLTHLKFAAILPSGLYPEGHTPEVLEYVPAVAGAGGTTAPFPLQVSAVGSLLTDAQRGRAHRGRIYMPPMSDAVNSSGMWSSTPITGRVNALATLLNAINTAMEAPVVVMSALGAGTTREVTSVAVGNRPDIQRRRAAQMTESYTTVALA